ncbi:hypothetical protein BC777_2740 [Yoonia maricola]|uniref:Uncharacterized protein n=1 Tax=Yoonia maricola TaxID=420999 RepID=A0A2M8W606_9RHOB|nr:hypothetical protein BC777_2740 [Yoonia maricola]
MINKYYKIGYSGGLHFLGYKAKQAPFKQLLDCGKTTTPDRTPTYMRNV